MARLRIYTNLLSFKAPFHGFQGTKRLDLHLTSFNSLLHHGFLSHMRHSLIALVLLFISSLSLASGGTSLSSFTGQSAGVSGQSEFLRVDEAFQFTATQNEQGLLLSWKIAKGYYLYKERFTFKISDKEKSSLIEIGSPVFSSPGKPKQDDYFGLVHAYYNNVDITLPITLDKSLNEAEIRVSYQGCAEAGLCYPPKKQTVLFVKEKLQALNTTSRDQAPAASPTTVSGELNDATAVFSFIQHNSIAAIIGIFFLLGIGLTFTPCVFPMIPIITSIIAGQKSPTTGKSFMLALAYVLGMAITYAAAGVITGLVGAGANIQAALQDPILLSVFAAIFFLLALSMFGLYELQLPAFVRDRLNTTSQNLSGGQFTSVFLIGALSALIVSPCVSAPLAGALLYISATADAVIGGLSLFALGLGMGVPLILIAIGGGKFFPKAGAWMDKVKYAFGIMLIAVAIWLLSRFISPSLSMLLWSLLCGLTASQMGAFEAAKPGLERLGKGLGLFLALYAAMLFIGALSGAQNPLKPLEKLSVTTTEPQNTKKLPFKTIYSYQELKEEIKYAETNKLPVLVDFYADWCISCIVMENEVFPMPNIKNQMLQFHLVKADLTKNDETNKQLLTQFGLFGPPSILFFDQKGKELERLRIVGEIDAKGFDQRLAKALNSLPSE